MTDAPPKDQQQFEQVLNRLDALIKRSHSGVAELPAAVESAALELIPPTEEEPPSAQDSGSLPIFVMVESTPIPILTDVYEGEKASPPPSVIPSDNAANLAPAMLEALDRAIHEELAQLQQSLAIRLRREITAALQQLPTEAAAEKPVSPDTPAAGD